MVRDDTVLDGYLKRPKRSKTGPRKSLSIGWWKRESRIELSG